jgi:site-specific DNA-methyltransferase (adenine-specific)
MTAPYYADESVTLYQGDCELILSDWLSEFARTGAHIVVTSPPYNMGLVPGGNGRGMYRPGASSKGGRFRDGYGQAGDAMPQDEYDALHRRILGLLWEIIPGDGAIFWNHRQRIEHGKVRLPLGMDFGIPLRQIITWDRGTGIAPNLRHFTPVAEWVFLFAKPGFKLRDHSASGCGDVWRLGMAQKDHGHPAPFPEGLPLRAIDSCAARHVLDPFAGSGTTLVAAKRLGVPAIGIELEGRFCKMAVQRLAQGALFGGAA